MPKLIETHDANGIDHAWVMQVTFVTTILIGAPLVAIAGLFVSLPTWNARAEFAIRVGAIVWLLTASTVYVYARVWME